MRLQRSAPSLEGRLGTSLWRDRSTNKGPSERERPFSVDGPQRVVPSPQNLSQLLSRIGVPTLQRDYNNPPEDKLGPLFTRVDPTEENDSTPPSDVYNLGPMEGTTLFRILCIPFQYPTGHQYDEKVRTSRIKLREIESGKVKIRNLRRHNKGPKINLMTPPCLFFLRWDIRDMKKKITSTVEDKTLCDILCSIFVVFDRPLTCLLSFSSVIKRLSVLVTSSTLHQAKTHRQFWF